jgi:flagellin-like hook-associated protein FlgL
MDFNLNINGLNKDKYWNDQQKRKKKHREQVSDSDQNLPQDLIDKENQDFKGKLIDLQNYVTTAQGKINFLDLASEALDDISGSLTEIRSKALKTIDLLDSYELSEEIKEKLDNVGKLEKIQVDFENFNEEKDKEYLKFIEELRNTTNTTLKLAKSEDFKSQVNNNPQIEKVLNDLNSTINTISSTKEHLSEVKNSLINNIVNLSITLENMVSSYSKIRNIELASETIKLTQHQIINEALKCISLQAPDTNITVNKLVN